MTEMTRLAQAIQDAINNHEDPVLFSSTSTHSQPSSNKKRTSAVDLICTQPWAITSDMLETIVSIAQRENESPEAVAARLGRPLQNTRTVTQRGSTAMVPVTGPIFRYANMFTEISGATSLDRLAQDFNTALDDPSVESVVLNVDSPGGQATGIAEFADMVRNASKPVVAYVDGMGASAAYWIAAAADELVMSKTAEVGSIGAVFGAYKKQKSGDSVEFVSSQSPMKRPDPESSEGQAEMQRRIDGLAQVFIEDVATYRSVTVETVLSDFGRGGVRLGEEAVKLGMADRVSTLEEVIAGLAGSTKGDFQHMGSEEMATPAASQPVIDRAYLDENHGDLVADIRGEGIEAGTNSERDRILSIITSESAAARQDMAQHLAFESDMSAEDAIALLDKAPVSSEKGPSRLEAAMSGEEQPNIGADAEGSAEVSDSQKIVADFKAATGRN